MNCKSYYNKISCMQSEPIIHQTDQYRLTVKLDADTLLLQLNIRGERNREVVALKRFLYEDLPEKMKMFGNIEEVFKYFRKPKFFEVDPQSATVTVSVFEMKDFEPVKESVLLPLEK